MTARALALALLAAAAILHFGVTGPTRREASAAQDAYRQARDARREAALRLSAAERRAQVREQLRSAAASARGEAPGDALGRLRRDAIAASERAGLSRVRLAVSHEATRAALTLTAYGSLEQLAALAADLPANRAVVLERVRFVSAGPGLEVELQGARPGA